MSNNFISHIEENLAQIKDAGLYKREREIVSAQSEKISVRKKDTHQVELINLCANNYLGLANHPRLIEAAHDAFKSHGYGMASVRFICGTQDVHLQLEKRLAKFLGKDDALLFAACFDANGGLFEPLLGPEDAIISDSLNHASIIDGIRLCKAKRFRYANSDMGELETRLDEAKAGGARFIMIATDGVFSMDGHLAKLPQITELANRFGAIVMVDDCHATGILGPQGRGTPAHFNVGEKVDILTGTLGKALGGGIGGYIAGPQAIIDLLRQRARPYLFSNSLPPAIAVASLSAIDMAEHGDDRREQLFNNTAFWRKGLTKLGFELIDGEHPIVPVILGEAKLAQEMARQLFEEGVFVAGFFFPVVAKGMARIRTQMNAQLSTAELEFCLEAFEKTGKNLGILR
ncbi:MAG: glycine C-acetyltransferase [Devosiaceae bacterium]|nr:glycine C-acetyltransferase [Devosiaceae bacterium]